MQVSVFIATSLDGYIARPDGAIDWLVGPTPDPEDYGYHAFIATVDVLVMGRNSYLAARAFPQWPYAARRVIVMSRSLTQVPATPAVELSAATPAALVQTLAAAGVHRIYLDGGLLIQSFLQAGLVTDLTITTIPVLLGRGLPLFGPVSADLRLRHVRTQTYPSGYVQSTYAV